MRVDSKGINKILDTTTNNRPPNITNTIFINLIKFTKHLGLIQTKVATPIYAINSSK